MMEIYYLSTTTKVLKTYIGNSQHEGHRPNHLDICKLLDGLEPCKWRFEHKDHILDMGQDIVNQCKLGHRDIQDHSDIRLV